MNMNSDHSEGTRSEENKQQGKDTRVENKTSDAKKDSDVRKHELTRQNAMKATLRVMQDYDKTFKRLSD